MSKPSRRPNREEIKAERKQYKQAQKKLRQEKEGNGVQTASHSTISNCKSRYESIEEERLLSKIDTSQIENIHLELIKEMIQKKKFRRYLIDKCYPIAIDGTEPVSLSVIGSGRLSRPDAPGAYI